MTPTVSGHYWATHKDSEGRDIFYVNVIGDGRTTVWRTGDYDPDPDVTEYTDWYGPLTDPKEATHG